MRSDIFTSQETVLESKGEGSLAFLFRQYAPGDEYGMMECVKDEYKDTYFKRNFYDPDKIRANALSDRYCYFVAEHDGEIAGMVIFALFHDDGDDYIEPASNIIRRKYRGFGLAHALVYYALPFAEKLDPSCLFVHAVTFHSATPALCEGYGMTPVGFRLGRFLASLMDNSYDSSRCRKYSEGVMIKPVRKRAAGRVYLPEELAGYAHKIYGRLGAQCDIVSAAPDEPCGDFGDEAELDISRDQLQRFVGVKVRKSGKDIAERMKELIGSFNGEPDWAVQIELSASSPAIFSEYDMLKEAGFFFSGLKPLCGAEEKLYMQWVSNASLDMDRYVLTESFDEIRRDIEGFFAEGKGCNENG